MDRWCMGQLQVRYDVLRYTHGSLILPIILVFRCRHADEHTFKNGQNDDTKP